MAAVESAVNPVGAPSLAMLREAVRAATLRPESAARAQIVADLTPVLPVAECRQRAGRALGGDGARRRAGAAPGGADARAVPARQRPGQGADGPRGGAAAHARPEARRPAHRRAPGDHAPECAAAGHGGAAAHRLRAARGGRAPAAERDRGTVRRVHRGQPHRPAGGPGGACRAAPVDAGHGARLHRRRDHRQGARARAHRAEPGAVFLRRAGRGRAHRQRCAALPGLLRARDRGAGHPGARGDPCALGDLGEAVGARAALLAAAGRPRCRANSSRACSPWRAPPRAPASASRSMPRRPTGSTSRWRSWRRWPAMPPRASGTGWGLPCRPTGAARHGCSSGWQRWRASAAGA